MDPRALSHEYVTTTLNAGANVVAALAPDRPAWGVILQALTIDAGELFGCLHELARAGTSQQKRAAGMERLSHLVDRALARPGT